MKKNILLIVLGMVIGASIGVYAISASEVTYNNTTLDNTLNNLYSTYNNISIGNATDEYSAGVSIANRSVTKELTKGKYVITAVYGMGAQWDGGYNSFNESDILPTCTNSGDCIIVNKKSVDITQASTTGGQYLFIRHGIFYVEVLADTTTITYNHNYGANYNSHATILNMLVSKFD